MPIRHHGQMGGRLPADYFQLDYLEGTGTQWIDTGFCAVGGDIVDFEWTPLAFNESNTLGSHNPRNNSSNGYNRNQAAFARSTHMQFTKCGYYNYASCPIQIVLGTKYHIVYNTINGNRIGSVNGYSVINQTNTGVLNPVNNMYFFHNGYDNTNNKGRIHNAKIYDSSETLVRDYIAVLRISDNEPGLYDFVNGVFYTNAGTGVFLYA